MKISRYDDVKWLYGDELDIHIGVEDGLPQSDEADIVYAKLSPDQTLRRHKHDRTPEAYEAFFFFQGGHIRLLLDGEREQELSELSPFHLTFHGDEVHGITNLAAEPVVFEVLCAPRHVAGEETVL